MIADLAVVLVSGGLDSVTLGYEMVREGGRCLWLSFAYGQRHRREVEYAARAAKRAGAGWELVDLTGVGRLLGGNALTGGAPVPEGHYAAPSMAVTVVPNRNAMMLAVAFGVASAVGAEVVATAVHAGDHPVYPDCRPAFIEAFAAMEREALAGMGAPRLVAPYVTLTKAEIVSRGVALGVPYAETWSCYVGGDVHCGRCGTCVERREAFELAGVSDPTEYARGS